MESVGTPFATIHCIYNHVFMISTINVTKQDLVFFRLMDPYMYKKGWKNNSTPSTTLALIDMYLIFIPIYWKIGKQAWFWFLVTKQDFEIYHENIIVSLNCSFQNAALTIVSWLNTIQCIKILCLVEILHKRGNVTKQDSLVLWQCIFLKNGAYR